MPTLHWIGKDAVVNHHKEVPFRLLKCNEKLSVGTPRLLGAPFGDDKGRGGEVGNLLVQGDNLEALKALLPHYAGQVKCIYIDPPYNTGNEGWVYNDNVNSPEMKAWLGKVVGGESEDLSRHDKWLCMMYPRLSLLVQFLRPDGFLFVSLDEIEAARRKIKDYQNQAETQAFQDFLFSTKDYQLVVTPEKCFTFHSEEYPYPAVNTLYQHSFKKHYYQVVGDLKSEGEEFECARLLDTHPKVKRWIRNLDGHPQFSFWLQTSTDKFYPDFVCELTNGKFLVIEYKGEHLWSNEDSKEKKMIGEKWAELSNSKCLFVMPNGPDWNAIQAKLR